MRLMYALISLAVCLVVFQNLTPFFPRNNINTVTIQKQGDDQKYRTTTPHIPATDFTRDGLIGMRRRGSVVLFPMKPNNVVDHLKHPKNELVGANVMRTEDLVSFDLAGALKTHLPAAEKAIFNSGFKLGATLLCEKTNRYFNPYVCDGDFDCYRLTIVARVEKPLSPLELQENDEDEGALLRLSSVEVVVKVANPKTSNAKIVSIVPLDPDGAGPLQPEARLSDELPNSLLNEITVAGDNRLLVARLGQGVSTYKDESGNLKENTQTNMIYSVYPVDIEPCDVTEWDDQFHPVSYAYHDEENHMRERYKFAKYPLKDSMGTVIPKGADFGGSYPWMDKEAANLFFTAFGMDNFYNPINGRMRTPYSFLDSNGSLISIDKSLAKPTESSQISYFEARGGRTVGVALAGFWTHGRTVLLDGLINNADYNFSIASTRKDTSITGEVNRQLDLYRLTPPNQTYERVGGVRELGDGFDRDSYDINLTPNSTFLGSLENRLNYHTKIKPITPRDIVWHFGTTRQQDEVVFDDYIDPYFLINAEMTGSVAFNFLEDQNKSMKHFDGFQKGIASAPILNFQFTRSNVQKMALTEGAPVLFQNAATAPEGFLNVPHFGIPIGDVRLEPIAKGGIYGKGVWLEKSSGLSFTVPAQPANGVLTTLNSLPADRYISVFIDPRNTSRSHLSVQTLFSLISANSSVNSVKLVASNSPSLSYNSLILTVGAQTIAEVILPTELQIKAAEWSHIGIQFFNDGSLPKVYINGFRAATFRPINSSRALINTFFNPNSGARVILGSVSKDSSLGIRGWFDDFKFTMRSPTIEEKCNYARGTLVRVDSPSASTPSAQLAMKYPIGAHREITSTLNQSFTGQRYICFTKYSEQIKPHQLLNAEPFAHLKNLPEDTTSVRDSLLMGGQKLIYNQPRADFTGNKFCLSCHLQPQYIRFSALNTNALTPGTVHEQDDARRQPMQPPQNIRGIIPENYFGAGLPTTQLKLFQKQKIDQWILRGDP